MAIEINEKKNNIITLPLKLSLTEKGIYFYINHKRKISKIRMSDNELVYGIQLENTTYEYLRKLIKANFISKIENR